MPLPVKLKPGVVSIYGVPSNYNIAPQQSNYLFGVVDAIWNNMPCNVSIGDNVMFDKDKLTTNPVFYDNIYYYLVKANDVEFVENNLV